MSGFTLEARLRAASLSIAKLALCEVRLQDDARWPWLVLVPVRAGLVELEDLAKADRARLFEEAVLAGEAVRSIGAATGFAVEKLNVGALGNIVPQLHLHVVGRRAGDPAWPGPVWGAGEAQPYAAALQEVAAAAARRAFAEALSA